MEKGQSHWNETPPITGHPNNIWANYICKQYTKTKKPKTSKTIPTQNSPSPTTTKTKFYTLDRSPSTETPVAAQLWSLKLKLKLKSGRSIIKLKSSISEGEKTRRLNRRATIMIKSLQKRKTDSQSDLWPLKALYLAVVFTLSSQSSICSLMEFNTCSTSTSINP